jgi:exosome complex component RRP42
VVNAEFLPLSSALIEPGPPDEDSIEVSRVVDRGIRESQMLDLNALVIETGKLVNCVFVDVDILNMDGNLFDVAFIAAALSIATAKFDKKIVKEDGTEETKKVSLPLRLIPVSITSITIGDNIILDPTEEEDSVHDSRMTITFDEQGHICAGQKGGSIGLPVEQLFEIVSISKAKAEEILLMIKKVMETA